MKMTHDEIIEDIVNRLYKRHVNDKIGCKEEYVLQYKPKLVEGECDLYLINHHYAYAVEVKITNTKKHKAKAIEQLDKDAKYLKQHYNCNRMFCFFAYTSNNHKTKSYDVELVKSINYGNTIKHNKNI